MKSFPDFGIESEYWKKGYTVLGIDEVGRGCLAGPVTVGLAAFSPQLSQKQIKTICGYGIHDSKKLTPRKRKQLVQHINNSSIYIATTYSSVKLINTRGIEHALHHAI